MRTKIERVILAVVLAAGLISGRAAAEPGPGGDAPAAGGEAPAAAQPTPKLAAVPASGATAAAASWQEGFQLVPMIGLNSFQGDSRTETGPGLRLGLLAGSRMSELLSLNVGFAFDMVNFSNVPDGASASEYLFDIGFNPLFHFPLEKVEIVAGPLAGIFLDKGAATLGTVSVDTWGYGWTLGANAGLMVPVSSKVRLGGLLNFYLRNPLKICATANGSDMCQSSNLTSEKTLALSFAAML